MCYINFFHSPLLPIAPLFPSVFSSPSFLPFSLSPLTLLSILFSSLPSFLPSFLSLFLLCQVILYTGEKIYLNGPMGTAKPISRVPREDTWILHLSFSTLWCWASHRRYVEWDLCELSSSQVEVMTPISPSIYLFLFFFKLFSKQWSLSVFGSLTKWHNVYTIHSYFCIVLHRWHVA